MVVFAVGMTMPAWFRSDFISVSAFTHHKMANREQG
jgi:hypothetical protein